jgi:uncharacterized RDD family membrane protein YckC
VDTINPYASPEFSNEPAVNAPVYVLARQANARIMPRYFAASAGTLLSIGFALIAGMLVPSGQGAVQAIVLVGVWWGYFLVFELLFSSSIGKLLFGLIIVSVNGDRITRRQAIVRTLFRLLEVNPIFLGGLPAAACIIFSSKRQRFGDMAAGTVVVPRAILKMRAKSRASV